MIFKKTNYFCIGLNIYKFQRILFNGNILYLTPARKIQNMKKKECKDFLTMNHVNLSWSTFDIFNEQSSSVWEITFNDDEWLNSHLKHNLHKMMKQKII